MSSVVMASLLEILEQLLKYHGLMGDLNKLLRDVETTETIPPPKEQPIPETWESVPGLDPYVLLGLRPGAPKEVVDAAYRALAKKYHPDAGGSVEMMSVLNEAYHHIKETNK
jgi:DnaJ-domain-containing protein 1